MSTQPGGGRSRAPGPQSEPRAVSDILPNMMELLKGELFRRGDPAPADPDGPPIRSPRKREPAPTGRTAMLGSYVGLPRRVIAHPELTDADVRLYGAILACCWSDQPFTAETNATLREKLGGVNRLEIREDRGGRKHARWVAESGPSDDYIRRGLARLERAKLIQRIDDPLAKSGRRINLVALVEAKPGGSA